jgi:hypothetical protein
MERNVLKLSDVPKKVVLRVRMSTNMVRHGLALMVATHVDASMEEWHRPG